MKKWNFMGRIYGVLLTDRASKPIHEQSIKNTAGTTEKVNPEKTNIMAA
jgi:hypothetical protein